MSRKKEKFRFYFIALLVTFLEITSAQDFISDFIEEESIISPKIIKTSGAFPDDLDAAESIHRAFPYNQNKAYGYPLEAERQRLKLIEEVLPPENISYYRPYGDRTVALLKYPVMTPKLFKAYYGHAAGYSYAEKNNCSGYYQPPLPVVVHSPVVVKKDVLIHEAHSHVDEYGQLKTHAPAHPDLHVHKAHTLVDEYGHPVEKVLEQPPPATEAYGPPPVKEVYGPPPPPVEEPLLEKTAPDVGVIVAQSYILRENVRDYLNQTGFSKGKPSKELLTEMVEALAKSNFEEMQKWNPPLNPFYNVYVKNVVVKHKEPTFVLLHLESYLKTSNNSRRFGFLTGKTYSNGTIYFPKENNPEVMTNIPFVLHPHGGIDYIFGHEGYELHDFGTLVKAKTEIKSFVKLTHNIHDRVHKDGRKAMERLIKNEEKLEKPKFVNTTADDPEMVRREAEAKVNMWLYTSSIAVRSISFEKKVVKHLDFLVLGEGGVLHHHGEVGEAPPEVTYLPEFNSMFKKG